MVVNITGSLVSIAGLYIFTTMPKDNGRQYGMAMIKKVLKDMKDIYTAPTKQATEMALNAFEDRWNSKYSYAVKFWRENWEELTVFLISLWKEERLFILPI